MQTGGGRIVSVLIEKKDRILVITLNRPEAMNTLDQETREELNRVWIKSLPKRFPKDCLAPAMIIQTLEIRM